MRQPRNVRATLAFALILLLVNAAGIGRVNGQEADGKAPVDIEADDYTYDPKTGWATGKGDVHLTYMGMSLEADYVNVNIKTKDVEAQGNIYFSKRQDAEAALVEEGIFIRGEELTGNLDTREFDAGDHKISLGVWYEKGSGAEYEASGKIVMHDVALSTCEYLHEDHAHYSLHAKKVVYSPEGKIRARHVVYRVFGIPVFYWPYVLWDTDRHGGNIAVDAGYEDDWGYFLLLGRKWRIGDNTETMFRLDLRSKRGIAVGNETEIRTKNSKTQIELYGMHDDEPEETSDGYVERFEVEKDRYRAHVYHEHTFGDRWSLRLNVDALSDFNMLEEWYEDEFEAYRQTISFVDLRYDHPRFTLSLNARPRVNDFYTVAERLPELRLDFPRQSLLADWGLYYEGETSAANLNMSWRDFDLTRDGGGPDPDDYETVRLDSLHMLYRPFKAFGGKLNIVPRAGIRATYYEDTTEAAVTDDDLLTLFLADDPERNSAFATLPQYDDDGGSELRIAGEVGVELSTKFFRVWEDAKKDWLGINGLRHVVQPYLNYTYMPKPSETADHLLFFDEVDRLTKLNVLRVGVNQRLQTRNAAGDGIYTLASMETYADFHFETPGERETLGEFGTRIEVVPSKKTRVWGTLIADMHDGDLRFAEAGVGFQPFNDVDVKLSYLFQDAYIADPLISMGSTLSDYNTDSLPSYLPDEEHMATLSLQFPLGDKMSGYMRYEYDIEDGELDRQLYQLTRDLHCWMGALRIEEDDDEFLVQLILYLKAFPDLQLGSGI